MDSTIVFGRAGEKNKAERLKSHGAWRLIPCQFFTHCWDEILNKKQFEENGVY